jgi:hypothetical protein
MRSTTLLDAGKGLAGVGVEAGGVDAFVGRQVSGQLA